jgi:hypothetical protein
MKIKSLLYLLILITLNSCVSTFDGSFHSSPSFSIKDNFRIVSTIEGHAEAQYIFGIGGGFIDGLVNEAKWEMYSSYALQPNQNITNITVDKKVTSFIIPILYQRRAVIVSADVIEFYDAISNLKSSEDISITEAVISSNKKVENSETGVSSNSKVIDDSKIILWTNEERKYFELITSFTQKTPTTRIAKVKDLKVGDVVSYTAKNNDGIIYREYGVIQEINDEILEVNTYPKYEPIITVSASYLHFRKVVY